MSRSLVAVNAQGRVTLPADVRRRLRLNAGDQLEVAVDDDRITLRPARVLIAEDAWAYAAESLDSIRRALDDIREGHVYRSNEASLLAGRYPRRGQKRSTRGAR